MPTELTEEEKFGLQLTYISTHEDLAAAEANNIEEAFFWVDSRHYEPAEVLDEFFLRELHRRMFCNVWEWAGKYRPSFKPVGSAPNDIPNFMHKLSTDAKGWVSNTYDRWHDDVIGAHLHHRLVSIHPFPNGNGRWGRAATDILFKTLHKKPFTWGGMTLLDIGQDNAEYISVLKAADRGDYEPLIRFVRKPAPQPDSVPPV